MKYLLAIVTGVCVVIMSAIFVLGFFQKQQRESATPSQPEATPTPANTNSGNTVPTQPVQSTQTFTTTEVSSHNTATNCWLIVNGNVYDVSKFLSQHPGGEAEILPYCGKEATKAFDTQGRSRGSGHSTTADQMLQDYKIGTLKN